MSVDRLNGRPFFGRFLDEDIDMMYNNEQKQNFDVRCEMSRKKKKKRGRGLIVLLVVLVLALAAVAGVIAFKEHEYGVSADYYDSLRTGDGT